MAATKTPTVDTSERILEVAERLVQRRGYNSFSYADIAAELSITKASVHYHFVGKAELGERLVEGYSARFDEALEEIGNTMPGAGAKLDAYADLYADVLRGERMCLCGMLAAEYQTLPEPMRDGVRRFFDRNVIWLTNVLSEGRSDGSLRFDGSPSEAAQTVLSALQGAMLLARPYSDPQRFLVVAGGIRPVSPAS